MSLADNEDLRKQFRKANFHSGGMVTARKGLMTEAEAIAMERGGNVEEILDECTDSCDLGFLNLTAVPPRVMDDIGDRLVALNLESNALHALPDDFGRLMTLKRLTLRKNRLRSLPVSMCMLEQLEQLDISNNLIAELPQEFADLVALQRLVADFNALRELPACCLTMPALRELLLVENPAIVAVPESAAAWANLLRDNASSGRRLYLELDNTPELVSSVERMQFNLLSAKGIVVAPGSVLPASAAAAVAAAYAADGTAAPTADAACPASPVSPALVTYQNECPVEVKWNKIWPDKVVAHLALGSLRTVQNLSAVSQLGVTHVLTCGRNLKTPSFPPPIVQLVLDVDDSEEENLNRYFLTAIEFINDAISKNGLCLVHCFAGVSRSATVVVAFLMHARKINFREALEFVQKHRPAANPNPNFRRQLAEFEKVCL